MVQKQVVRCVHTLLLGTILCVGASPSQAEVKFFDGFGDGDINNDAAIDDLDTDVGATPPAGLPNTYVPARLQDINGDGPANPEITSALDAGDTGLRWLQMRGFTGGSTGSSPNAGTGGSKPTIRIVDDSQGAMQETSAGGSFNVAAINTGYAMSWESKGGGSEAAAFFDEQVALGPEVDDEIKVSFDYRIWRDASNANATVVPNFGELRFGLFQDTDSQLGQTNPFAGRQEDTNGDGFVDDVPAIWGFEEGFFEGDLTGDKGTDDDVGSNGDNGWTASVFMGNPVISNGGGSRIREELQADRILQGSDVHTIAQPEDLDPDPFNEVFDFINLDLSKVYNISLSLKRATDTTPGDTIEATLTVKDIATGVETSFGGKEILTDHTSGGIPVPGTGGIQSDSWDYFALRNASSGVGEFDFILDNFMLEILGSNSNVGVPGDFNNNGTVDAADYTVWLDNLGSTFALNGNGDETGGSAGVVDQADYALWKASFGNTSGVGTGSAIPEPASAFLLVFGIGLFGCRYFRRSHSE